LVATRKETASRRIYRAAMQVIDEICPGVIRSLSEQLVVIRTEFSGL
jgi:hypothetical protein